VPSIRRPAVRSQSIEEGGLKTRIYGVVLAAALAAPAIAAETESNVYRAERWQGDFEYTEAEAWKESAVVLPPYPDPSDLLEVGIGNNRYDFFIDTRNLTLGDDEVTRYTLVLRSRSGAENIFFEGIRCINQQYRGYGYGSSDGKIHPLEQSEWKPVQGGDGFGFRFELARFYFCSHGNLPYDPPKIIDRIRYAEDPSDSASGRSPFEM